MGRWVPAAEAGGVRVEGRGGCWGALVPGRGVVVGGGADRTGAAKEDCYALQGGAPGRGNGAWARVPVPREHLSLPGRAGAAAAALGGKAYVVAGHDVVVLEAGEAAGEWFWARLPPPAGGAPPPRHSHAVVGVGGRLLFCFGGASVAGPSDELFVFDTHENSWRKPSVDGVPPSAREMHAAVLLADGKTVAVYGGRGADGQVLSDVVCLDTEIMRWGPRTELPYARCAHSAALRASDGAVLVFGGFSGEDVSGDLLAIDFASDPIRPSVSVVAPAGAPGAPSARFAHTAVAVGGAMVVFGGVSPAEDHADAFVWVEDNDAPAGPAIASDLD